MVAGEEERRVVNDVQSPSEPGQWSSKGKRSSSSISSLQQQPTIYKSVESVGAVIKQLKVGTTPATAADPLVPGSDLISRWGSLVVRVMSARNHDFGNAAANSFYSQEVGVPPPCDCSLLFV